MHYEYKDSHVDLWGRSVSCNGNYVVGQALAQPGYCYHGSLEASFIGSGYEVRIYVNYYQS